MKRLEILLAILVMALIVVGCGYKEKKADQERKMKQQRFEENLLGYPSEFEPFLLQVLDDISVKEKQSLGMLKLEKGIKIIYQRKGEIYEGTLSHDVYCLHKGGKTFLTKGTSVAHGKAHFERFTIEPFKEEWKKDELQPVLKKYALTVYIPMDGYRGAALETYEEFMDIWDPDKDVEFYVGEPRPKFIAWKGKEPYLTKESGGFWNKRK